MKTGEVALQRGGLSPSVALLGRDSICTNPEFAERRRAGLCCCYVCRKLDETQRAVRQLAGPANAIAAQPIC